MNETCNLCGKTYDEAMDLINKNEPPFDKIEHPNVTQMYKFNDDGITFICLGPCLRSSKLKNMTLCPYCFHGFYGDYDLKTHCQCVCSFCRNSYPAVFYKGTNSMTSYYQGYDCAGFLKLVIDKKKRSWEGDYKFVDINYRNKDEIMNLYIPGESKLIVSFCYGSKSFDMDAYEYDINILKEIKDVSSMFPETVIDEIYIPESEGNHANWIQKIVSSAEIPISICDFCVKTRMLQYLIGIERMEYMPRYLELAPVEDIRKFVSGKVDRNWANEKMKDPEVRKLFYEHGSNSDYLDGRSYKDITESYEDFDRRFVSDEYDDWYLKK